MGNFNIGHSHGAMRTHLGGPLQVGQFIYLLILDQSHAIVVVVQRVPWPFPFFSELLFSDGISFTRSLIVFVTTFSLTILL